MRFVSNLFTLLMICLSSAFGVELKGRVVDSESNPIPSASVVTDVASVGAMTDIDGRFSFSTDADVARVTVSSVGYKSRQRIQV